SSRPRIPLRRGLEGPSPGPGPSLRGPLMKIARLLVLTLASCSGVAKAPAAEVSRYFRVTPERRTLECSFAILRSGEGWSITSVTGNLSVEARYDAADRLLDAQAALRKGDRVRVEVSGGRAKIT